MDHRDEDQGPIEPQPFELSAFAADPVDELQVDASDLMAKDFAISKPAEAKSARRAAFNKSATVPLADHALFNALVSSVAPVTLRGSAGREAAGPVTATPADVAVEDAVANEASEVDEESTSSVVSEVVAAPVESPVESPVAATEIAAEAREEAEVVPPEPAVVADVVKPSTPTFMRLVKDEDDTVAEAFQIDRQIPEPKRPVEAPVVQTTVPVIEESFDEPAIEPTDFAAAFAPKAETDRDESDAEVEASLMQLADLGPDDVEQPRGRTGGWWTIPVLCAGVACLACALLIPAADENRRAMHELARIGQEVQYFEKQSQVNRQFLQNVSSDPTLVERLAMRQLRLTRPTARIVQMPHKDDPFSMSPYALVSVDPPAPLPEYRPLGGFLGEWFLNPKRQNYLAGLGLLITAAGVILGGGTLTSSEQHAHHEDTK